MDINIRGLLEGVPLPTTAAGLTEGYYPSAFLLVAGMIAILVAWNYVLYEGRGAKYRLTVIIGTLFSVFMAIYCGVQYIHGDWANGVIVAYGLLTFSLAFRMVLGFNVSAGMSLILWVVLYYATYIFAYGLVEVIGTIWVIFFVTMLAILFYMLVRFIEAGVEWAAGLFNSWPVLVVLGGFCAIESALQVIGMSIFGFF